MKNNYPHILLFILCSLFCSCFTFAYEGPISLADSTLVKTTDSVLTKETLPQSAEAFDPMAHWAKEKNKKVTVADATTAGYRSFPELDSYTNNLYLPPSNGLAEFTPEYVQNLFKIDNNTQELLNAGKEVFDIIDREKRFINIIGGQEIIELPVGITQPISEHSFISLGIVSMEYHTNYTVVDLFAKIKLAELGGEELFFAANNVKISREGGIYDEATLSLLGDFPISMNGGQWLVTLKGGKGERGKGDGQTYVTINCEGKVKELAFNADVRVAKTVAVPLNEDGSLKFPAKTEPGTGENPVGNDSYVGANIKLQTATLEDMLFELDLPFFELKALPRWGFKMEKTVLDLSDTKNAEGMLFPDIYRTQGLLQGNENLWRGFHSKEVRVMLPPEFKKKGSDKRIFVGAQNLFIDNFGVSGDFYATNVLDINEGDASKWQISVDSIGVDLKVNRFIKAGFNGDIVLPISDQKSTGGTLAYKGLITADQYYSVNVEATDDVSFDVFKAQAKIYKGSYVKLEVENDRFYPEANLTGQMAFSAQQKNQLNEAEGDDGVELEFDGLSFENFKIQTRERPYLSIGRAGFKDDIKLPKLAGFELGFYDVEITSDENDNATLALNCYVNLDDSGIHGDVGLEINGALEQGDLLKWRYQGIEVTDIEIDVKRKSFEFYGKASFFKDNPIYGKGFSGELQLYAEDLGIEVGARGLFGAVDGYRYWFVDGHGRPTKNNNTNFTIFDIGGGVYHHMRKAGMDETATSLSGIKYQPDINTSLGFKALAAFEIKSGAAFTALAGIEIAFNSQAAGGGVSRLGFYGAAMLIQGKSGGGNPQTPFGTVDQMQQTVSAKEQALGNFHELSIDKEGLKYFADEVFPELLTGEELFAAQVAIDFDFRNRAYWGLLDVYLNAGAIRGEGEKNHLGRLEYYNSPDDWYIYVGTPTHRFGLADIPIGPFLASINMYFMTGTILPDPAQPPQNVIDILHLSGNELEFGRNFDQELARGTGYAFGAKFQLGMGFDWGLVYASVSAGAGFDLMMRDFGDAHCKGKEGPIGMDGWYSTGQMYAYLQGEIGARIKVFGIKKDIPILSAGIAVLAQAQLPNPWFIKGYAGVDIKVLGLVNIHTRLKVIIGEECEIIGKTGLQDVVMISDITPRDGLTDVDVFDAVQVAFNAPIGEPIYIEEEGGKKTYRISLDELIVKNANGIIEGSQELNENRDLLTFNSSEVLPPEDEITVIAKVSFEEKSGGNWIVVTENGSPVIEEKTVTFTTGDAPRKIPIKNIEYMYPMVEQQYMLPKEFSKGFVQLYKGQDYLFGNGLSDELYFIDQNGTKTKADFSYNKADKRLNFSIPSLDKKSSYTYALITLNPGDIEENQVMTAVEFNQISEDLEISNNTIVGNASNGAFISRLNFNFNTSEHNTFKQKIQSIKANKYVNQSLSNAAQLAVYTKDYEPFELAEIAPSRFNGGVPLIIGNALNNNRYFKNEIYPTIYENYPLDNRFEVQRDAAIYGLPPTRPISVSQVYVTYAQNQPENSFLKQRFPFYWDIAQVYREDFYHLQYEISNFYDDPENPKRKDFEYIIFSRFPYINNETYQVEFKYHLPHSNNGNKVIFDYKNEF
ncbi:hypothetical protein [Cytophaga sp. FL35]|uniref:hypothetical protein n=1 Tax=Cytophaga sp. FL35 TaxID=1904456 RepID=UPI0016534F6E|nr:hypothetical protein [Cytophaga sp. FL35]MBC6997704.1 hypothetical protein [Cytophaga sp. FL35]